MLATCTMATFNSSLFCDLAIASAIPLGLADSLEHTALSLSLHDAPCVGV